GSTVVLDASGSSDAEDPNASLSFFWDLDGDGLFGETGPNAKNGDEVGINPTLNSTGLPVGPNTVKLEVVDTGGKWSVTTATINVKSASLTVTIDQAAAQADPTNGSPINYTVVFNAPVSDFDSTDVVLSGTAGATTALVTGSGTTYNVA